MTSKDKLIEFLKSAKIKYDEHEYSTVIIIKLLLHKIQYTFDLAGDYLHGY